MNSPSKPRRRRHARDKSPEDAKEAVLAAALARAPFEGFTDSVLAQAGAEAGVSSADLARLFPDGPSGLVTAFSESADAEMARLLAKAKLANLKVRERIAVAVKTRIAVLRPHKEAARRAAAFLTLPPRAGLGAKLLYRTVDSIWRAVGDTSTDFNFYTKRAILAAVYSTTLLRWFSDSGEDEEITNEFLRRRIENVMRFEKFKAQVRESMSGLPSLAEILKSPQRHQRRSRGKGG